MCSEPGCKSSVFSYLWRRACHAPQAHAGSWHPAPPGARAKGWTYLQALLTSRTRDTPVWAAATSMCRMTSVESRQAPSVSRPRTSAETTRAWSHAPTCAGGHQLVQPLHRHAAGVVEVGHIQARGRVRGVHHEVPHHQEGPHSVQPGCPVTTQPGREQRARKRHEEHACPLPRLHTSGHHAADTTDSETRPGAKVKPALALRASRVTPWVRAQPRAHPKHVPGAGQSKDRRLLPPQAGQADHGPCRPGLDPAPDPGRAPG